MTGKKVVVLASLGLLAAATAVSAQAPAAGAEKEPGRRGIVFVLDGIGGHDFLPFTTQFLLPRAGVPHEIKSFHWSHGFGQALKDLQDFRHLHRKADELAGLILTHKEREPDRPVYLVGNSGGTALVLLAAEKLPPQTLERIILLAAAVSPDFDLRGALRATRGGIVNYYSSLDRLVLHWGTWQFGTADRHYVASAGCGFSRPADLTPEDQYNYDRLVQIPWEPRMMLHGHGGGHLGVHAPGFLMNEVAPWLRD
jgi:pimeloyl-ACP methyl ester carboxylesterase